MSETVLERSAEERVENVNTEPSVSELVSDLRTEGDEVRFTTFSSDGWERLCSLEELRTIKLETIIKRAELTVDNFSDEELENLRELKKSVKYATDENGMYRLEPEFNDDGQIRRLVIPLSSPISEDVEVCEVYSENGEFVAHEIEEQVGSDIYKLRTADLYVESINDSEVKQKSEKRFRESLESNIREIDGLGEDFRDSLGLFGIVTVGAILSWGIPALIGTLFSPILGVAVFVFLCLLEMLPFLTLLGLIISIFDFSKAVLKTVSDVGSSEYSRLFRL